ncbi:MAG TPA: hypothetical protein VIS56_01100 [Candidatus Saccharimonadales bacterium]
MSTQTIERPMIPVPGETGIINRWTVAREVGRLLLAQSGREAIPMPERALTEVDNLNRLRKEDGSHDPQVLADTKKNLEPRVVEPSMPYAVSTTYQEYRNGSYWWIDQTGPQVAASGLRYHEHPAAKERVVVEIAEALDVSGLIPGIVKVFISPRMSPKDAPKDVAEAEHLADDDMLRIHWIDSDEVGNVRGKIMQSILVRDIPLKAWVDMLASPDNIFGKSIKVDDPESALSVMKTFAELDLPMSRLPEGVVTILDEVVRFISEPQARKKVMQALPLYRDNQQLMRQVAGNISNMWLSFEIDLADSLYDEAATPAIEKFIDDLKDEWTDDDLALISSHRREDGSLHMTRRLAVRLEEARQNTFWAQAAAAVGNERVTKQMDSTIAKQINANMMAIQHILNHGGDPRKIAELESENTRLAASQNVEVKGGCPGGGSGNFRKSTRADGGSSEGNKENKPSKNEKAKFKEKKGSKREWMRCVHCPLCSRDGVDAYIDYFPEEKKKRITCCTCKGHKDYSL